MTKIDRRAALRRVLGTGLGAGAAALGTSVLAQDARGAAHAPGAAPSALREAVAARERAFAATLARRDRAAFADFVSEEAVFLNGGHPLVGRDEIVRRWSPFFDGPTAPFAWEPDLVAVLASGRLATSTGPVTMPDGTRPSRFYSTWRLEADGRWRVVFDNGYDVCTCPAAVNRPAAG
jgi:uncharacterized protein (TIGR02246 family)